MPGEHPLIEKAKDFYKKHYKRFFIVPALAVLFCLLVLGANYARTGEIVERGIDLKGGTIVTVDWAAAGSPDLAKLHSKISGSVGGASVHIAGTSAYSSTGLSLAALDFEAGPNTDPQALVSAVKDALSAQGFQTAESDYNMKTVGPAVGEEFLNRAYIALALGFFFMGLMILFLFKTPVAVATVLSCIFFDFLGGLAVMNLFGIALSPMTLAALLTLIGFSIDSDILITTATLNRHEGHVMDRAFHSMKTGVTMICTAAAALLAITFLSGSALLQDMTIILLGGLFFDVIHTWFTNLGVLLLTAERRQKTGKAAA